MVGFRDLGLTKSRAQGVGFKQVAFRVWVERA